MQSPPTSLCVADFYTAGHAKSDGSDIRVTTDDGTTVASHVLMMGPGDRARVAFALRRPIKNYFVYFGAGKPDATQPTGGELKFDCGLHLEMKALAGRRLRSFEGIEDAWNRGGNVIGETMIPEASLGFNPLGPEDQTISRITGTMFVPIDGEYVFSMFVRNMGALYVDGKPILFGTGGPPDTRNRAATQLTRGQHEFLFYHVTMGAEDAFLVAWQPPGSARFQTIGRGEFSPFHTSSAGPLRQAGAAVTADFSMQYFAESFFADGYCASLPFLGPSG